MLRAWYHFYSLVLIPYRSLARRLARSRYGIKNSWIKTKRETRQTWFPAPLSPPSSECWNKKNPRNPALDSHLQGWQYCTMERAFVWYLRTKKKQQQQFQPSPYEESKHSIVSPLQNTRPDRGFIVCTLPFKTSMGGAVASWLIWTTVRVRAPAEELRHVFFGQARHYSASLNPGVNMGTTGMKTYSEYLPPWVIDSDRDMLSSSTTSQNTSKTTSNTLPNDYFFNDCFISASFHNLHSIPNFLFSQMNAKKINSNTK